MKRNINEYVFDDKFARVSAVQFFGDDPSVKDVMDLLETVQFKNFRAQLLKDLERGVSMLIHENNGMLYTVRPGSVVAVNEDGDLRIMTCRDFQAIYSPKEVTTNG